MLRHGHRQMVQRHKGFGFIAQDVGRPDLFVHFSTIQMNGYRALVEDERVRYEIVQGTKAPQPMSTC